MDIQQAQKNARLMGILYGVIIGMELSGDPITYAGIQQLMKQHCSARELEAVCVELQRYSEIVQTSRGEK